MKRLTMLHATTLSHAEQFIHSGMRPGMTPRFRTEVEADLVRIKEIRSWILKALFEPGLPLTTEIPEEPRADGNTDSGNRDRE